MKLILVYYLLILTGAVSKSFGFLSFKEMVYSSFSYPIILILKVNKYQNIITIKTKLRITLDI